MIWGSLALRAKFESFTMFIFPQKIHDMNCEDTWHLGELHGTADLLVVIYKENYCSFIITVSLGICINLYPTVHKDCNNFNQSMQIFITKLHIYLVSLYQHENDKCNADLTVSPQDPFGGFSGAFLICCSLRAQIFTCTQEIMFSPVSRLKVGSLPRTDPINFCCGSG